MDFTALAGLSNVSWSLLYLILFNLGLIYDLQMNGRSPLIIVLFKRMKLKYRLPSIIDAASWAANAASPSFKAGDFFESVRQFFYAFDVRYAVLWKGYIGFVFQEWEVVYRFSSNRYLLKAENMTSHQIKQKFYLALFKVFLHFLFAYVLGHFLHWVFNSLLIF